MNAEKLVRDHYENFPVASFLIPAYYRKDIVIVYWFARTADDIADEGYISKEERLIKLGEFEEDFKKSLNGQNISENFNGLAKIIGNRNLSETNFLKLIKAFRQDITKLRYENFNEILQYCDNSANPVGRILLEIFNIKNEAAVAASDNICTALQLTNFLQDTVIDYQKGRLYYPFQELNKFLVTENMFELKENNPNIKQLIKQNIERIQVLFNQGKNLLNFLSGRFKIEIKWTIAGGEKILEKIRKADYDIFSKRPELRRIDFITIFIKSLFL